MRNNIFRLLLISLAALALFGCQEQDTKPSTPIAVIDQVKIFEKSTNIKAAKEHGDAFLEKLNQEMVVLKELSEKEKNKEKGQALLEEGTREIQQRLQAEDHLITSKISALVEKAVKEVKEEIGATIIISTDLLIDYDAKADITDLIVAKIDKETISFSDKAVDEKEPGSAEADKAADNKDAQDKDAAKKEDTEKKEGTAEKAAQPSGK